MALAWVFSVSMIIRSIVHEKEARLKEVNCTIIYSVFPQCNSNEFLSIDYENYGTEERLALALLVYNEHYYHGSYLFDIGDVSKGQFS